MGVELRLFGQSIAGGRRARGMLDQLVEQQQQDAELAGVLNDLWAGSQRKMTREELERYTAVLHQRASDVKTVNASMDGFATQQLALREGARSDADRTQLDVLDRQAETARRLALSNNPELAKQGAQLMGELFRVQREYATTQEAQEIAGEAALGSQRWERFKSTYDDLYRESTGFLEVQRSYTVLRGVYKGDGEPGNAEDLAAINSLQRMIDPGATVRDGDVSLLQNLAGVPEWVITAANRVAKGGGRFTPAERAQMLTLGDRIMAAANSKQAETNGRFQAIGTAAELPAQFLNQLRIPISDTMEGGAGQNYGTDRLNAPPPVRDPQTDSTAAMIGSSAAAGIEAAAAGAVDFFEGLTGVEVVEPLEALGRATKRLLNPKPRYRTGGGFPQRPTDEYPQ